MSLIKKISAYEIVDSHGTPTIEAKIFLDNGLMTRTSVPAGGTSRFEVSELRDKDSKRFAGLGVLQAVGYINDLIGPKLVGISPLKQQEIDNWLIKADGTKNKSRLGGNTISVISQLIAKAGALESRMPLFLYLNKLYANLNNEELKIVKIPTPIFIMINGGNHASDELEFQEFQVIPSSSYSFSQAFQLSIEIFNELKKTLQYRNTGVSVGEEGGLTPKVTSNLDALELLNETIRRKDLRSGLDVFFGLDVAANFFYKSDRYILKEKPHPLNQKEFIDYLVSLIKIYPVLFLEDPLYEDDFDGWKKLLEILPNSIYLVADDLVASNKNRLVHALKSHSCSAVVIKPNQIGTITETFELVSLAKKNKLSYIVSGRAGETNDDFIADFAVAMQSEFIKFGSPIRGERVAKYNRLLEIEREELK